MALERIQRQVIWYRIPMDISMSLTVECTATVALPYLFCFCLFRRLDKFRDGEEEEGAVRWVGFYANCSALSM